MTALLKGARYCKVAWFNSCYPKKKEHRKGKISLTLSTWGHTNGLQVFFIGFLTLLIPCGSYIWSTIIQQNQNTSISAADKFILCSCLELSILHCTEHAFQPSLMGTPHLNCKDFSSLIIDDYSFLALSDLLFSQIIMVKCRSFFTYQRCK